MYFGVHLITNMSFQIALVALCLILETSRSITVTPTVVFPNAEADCGQIRTPELVVTPPQVLLFGQCRYVMASLPVVS